MIIFLFILFIIFCPVLSQSNNCPNCLYGCEITGTCWNSTCFPCLNSTCTQYYGNICNKSAPQANMINFIKFANSTDQNNICSGTVSTLPFNTIPNYSTIHPLSYYLLYGTDASLSNSDPIINTTSQILMNLNIITGFYETTLQFSQNAFYRFGAYFTFEDLYVYGVFQSVISRGLRVLIGTSNCTVTVLPTTTTTVKPTTTTVQLTTTSLPPTTTLPSNFSVQNVILTPNFTFITVNWAAPKSNTGLLSYNISINPGNQMQSLNNNINFYNFTSLNEATYYSITVTSVYSLNSFSVINSISTFSSVPPTNFSWDKFYIYGIIYWNLTTTPAPDFFKIYVNNNFQNQVVSNMRQFNVTNLVQAQSFLITVAAYYYGGREVNNAITVWTRPAPVPTIILPIINNITSKTFQVMFPNNPIYNGSINLYYVIVQRTSISSRRKRDALSCQAIIPGIPSTATIRYASNSSSGNQMILIGSGNTYPPLNCPNDNLAANTNYTVYAVIGSLVNGTAEYANSTTTILTPVEGIPAGIIAAIIIILLLLILLILLIYFCLRCRKKDKNFRGIKEYKDIKPKTYLYWSNIIDRMHSRKIILNNNNVFEGLTFKDEYENLPTHTCEEHCSAELCNQNYSYEYSGDRSMSYRLESTNYIASYIDGYIKKKAYISLQSPFDDKSISDFWLIVYSENVGQIVMMTLKEEPMKQNKYWPKVRNKTTIYGQIEVLFIDKIVYAYFCIRKFKIRKINSKECINVSQYHYRSWPVDNNLINLASFLEFHEIIKNTENIIFGPTVVHSHLGCPLNAVYIGFDILCNQLHKEQEVNVFREFGKLRRYRPNMMITIDQYMIVYDLLFESYLSGQYVVDLNFKKLIDSPTAYYQKFLDRQFQLLTDFNHLSSDSKIRLDKHFIFDGVEYPESIILTQTLNTFIEESINLWYTVFSNEIDIIVDLNNQDVNEIFYISHNLSNYEMLNKYSKKCKNNVICLTISVKKNDTNEIRDVVIYLVKLRNALDYDSSNFATWVELISNIINEQKYKLLVFNIEKSFLSSIFIVCLNASTKFLYSNFVSVYYTIKSLQSSGHPVLNDINEFKFIFEYLKTWIDMKMNNDKLDQEFKFGTVDMELTFNEGAYQGIYPNLNNSFSYSSKYPNNLYESYT